MADENKNDKTQPTILEIVENEIANKNITPTLKDKDETKRENQNEPHLMNDSFFSLFRGIDLPAVLTDEKNNIIAVNDSFSVLGGIKNEEVNGKKLSKILKKNILNLNDRKIEVEFKEIKTGLVSVFIFKNVNGKRENEISKDRINLLENIEDMIIEIKRNGRIVWFNNTSKKIIPDIKVDSNIKEFVKVNRFGSCLKEVLESKKEVESEGFVSKISLPVMVKFLSSNLGIYLILKNKSEKIKLNEEIRLVREQYEQLVNNTTDIICIIDKTGKFKFVNKQFEKQLHYKEPYPTIFEMINPEDVPNFIRLLTECENIKKGFQDKEIRIYNNKRRMYYFSISALPLIQNDVVVEYSMTLRDITEKKKSEDETVKEREKLKEDFKRLSEINKMKTEFVSMVSHDLKTPLTNIQGYASLLRNRMLGPNTPKQQEAVDIIDKESKRLAKLINDLLDLSKLDAGAITLHKRPFKLKDLEEKCSLRNLAERKGLVLIWNTPDTLGEVYGDPERIAQVVTNLVNNAIKFTDKGSVTVNAFEKDRNWIQLDVIDTGPGIPKKEQEMIFERFQRSSISKLYKKEGSGLGLAIAKEIMKLHDSDIVVKSEVGKGSVFSIMLPKVNKNNKTYDIEEYIDKLNIENIANKNETVVKSEDENKEIKNNST